MKSSKQNEQKLQEALRAAYFQKEKHVVGSRWKMDAMQDIRRLGTLNVKTTPLSFVDHFVWRFATVTCLVALMLSVYIGFTGWNPIDDVAGMFLSNPVEFTVAQSIGAY